MFIWPLVGLFVIVVAVMVLRRIGRVIVGKNTPIQDPLERMKCPCGYDLSRLDRARCPECGRVRFFDATPEQLGLSDEELKQLTEVQQRRAREERAKLVKDLLDK